MQEYYIRNPDSDESRGPFTMEQLNSLGETGHVTLETFVYNNDTEEWELLEHNEELRSSIFPEKKRLTMKPKTEFDSLNKGEAELAPVTIDDLLAAAEGNTEETRHKKQASIWREKAALGAMFISGIAFLLSAVALLWLRRDIVFAFDIGAMLVSPLVLFGLVDLAIALLLFLQTTAVYQFIRFRAMAGAGFFLFFFWAVEHPLAGLAAAAGSLGVYGLTIFLKMAPYLISATLALLGMAGFLILAFGI